MSTRACIIIHKPGAKKSTGGMLFKIYQHYDGYPEMLGANLVRGFIGFRGIGTLKEALLKADNAHENKFEITTGYHGDTEYLYHVYMGKRWGDRKVKITVQGIGASGYWDRELINEEEETLYEVIDNTNTYYHPNLQAWLCNCNERNAYEMLEYYKGATLNRAYYIWWVNPFTLKELISQDFLGRYTYIRITNDFTEEERQEEYTKLFKELLQAINELEKEHV